MFSNSFQHNDLLYNRLVLEYCWNLMKPRKLPEPEWAEIQDLRHLFGIKEGLAYRLLNLNLIKSAALTTINGAARGKRLIQLASVRAFLESQTGKPLGPGGPGCKGRKDQDRVEA